MSLHTKQSDLYEVYFCTVVCHKWLPLFEESKTYYSVYRWFEHLKRDGCFVLGYVIMPNHFHVLLYPTHSGTTINKFVGEGKRFMAYDMVKALKKQGKGKILSILAQDVERAERARGKKHQVFQLSFDARKCYDIKMIEQKLTYIHHNPVRGKWNLVTDFAKFEHSSASFYELGIIGHFPVAHYQELWKDIDATPSDPTKSSNEQH